MPAEGEGISASTLSVEISKSGSSRSTLSPGFLNHLVIVPSKMLSPIWGITMSTAIFPSPVKPFKCVKEARPSRVLQSLIPRELLRGVKNLLCVGQKIFLERRRIRHRCIERSDAQHRPVQVAEGFLAENCRDFAGDAAGLRVLVDDQTFVRSEERRVGKECRTRWSA